jgi:hypothetical protein
VGLKLWLIDRWDPGGVLGLGEGFELTGEGQDLPRQGGRPPSSAAPPNGPFR